MAVKKSKYFKSNKEIAKDYQNSIVESLASAGTAVALGFGMNAIGDKIPEKVRKFTGLSILAGGTVLNVYGKDSKVKAVAHGMTSFGGIQTVLDLAPQEAKFAFSFNNKGLGEIPTEEDPDAIQDAELERLAEEASQEIEDEDSEENINGVEDDIEEADNAIIDELVNENLQGTDEVDAFL